MAKQKTRYAVVKPKSEKLNIKGKQPKKKKKKKKQPDRAGHLIGDVYNARSEEERLAVIKKNHDDNDEDALREERIQQAIILDRAARRKEMREIGFVFTPSDEVLVTYYLKYKSLRRSMYLCPIDEVDVYANHPRTLTEQFIPSGGVWYFFTKSRPSENADIEGVWKFGEKKDVFDNGVKVGVRQELEFCGEGDQNGNEKYKMIEYQLHPATSAPLLVCKLSDGRGN